MLVRLRSEPFAQVIKLFNKFELNSRAKLGKCKRGWSIKSISESTQRNPSIAMQNVEIFHSLVNLAAADKKFTQEEIAFLIDRANQWQIPTDEFETAMAGIQEGTLEVTIPDSHEDRVLLLKEMIRLMAVDGEMADVEKRLCAQASHRMDFTSTQFASLLDEVIAEQS